VEGLEMIPLYDVKAEYINDNLERDNDNREQEVIHEVLYRDTILLCHHSLRIEDPQEHSKEGL
jgi:hypothetical protein